MIRMGVISKTPALATQLGLWLSEQRNFVVAWTAIYEQLKTLRPSTVEIVLACRENEQLPTHLLDQFQRRRRQHILVVGSYNVLDQEECIKLAKHGVRSFASIPRSTADVQALAETLYEASTGATPMDPRVVAEDSVPILRYAASCA